MDKDGIREAVWDRLEADGIARFPFPPHGRIPNYANAERAAERLTETAEWVDADTIKANPDSPQRPVRRIALEEGKDVYMAVPRLRDERCFLHLDPDTIGDPAEASTLSGSREAGAAVLPDALSPIDLIVTGCVAVGPDGTRIGKGEGYSDLEYAILRELSRVDADTPVATTVHPVQLRDDVPAPEPHDILVDVIVTAEETRYVERSAQRPDGINWQLLTDDDRRAMPILERLWDQQHSTE